MKKLLLLLVAIVFFSCKEEAPKDYVSLEGKIDNANNEILTIMGRNFKKEIKVSEDGSFKDTLKIVDGFHGFNDGSIQSFIYLKNGYDLVLDFDTKDFPNSISFEGEGSSTNNYLTEKLQFIKDEQLSKVRALKKIADERGQNVAQLAIAWVLRKEEVTSVLIGASRVSQIEDAVQALDKLDFETQELKMIEDILS